MDDSRTPEPPPPSVSVTPALPGPTMPGRNGGQLRRGNPGNKSRTGERSALAREILAASTPQAARILKHMSLKGEVPPKKKGEDAQPLTHPDHIKAVTAHLDRGGAPAVSALGVAPGSAFTIMVRAASDVETEPPQPGTELPAPPTPRLALPSP